MKVVLLAPHTIGDQPYAAGAEIDVDDETAMELRAAGKAGLPYDAKAQERGEYSARTGRQGDPAPHAPQAPEPLNAPERKKQ